jgi:hypothetical protein
MYQATDGNGIDLTGGLRKKSFMRDAPAGYRPQEFESLRASNGGEVACRGWFVSVAANQCRNRIDQLESPIAMSRMKTIRVERGAEPSKAKESWFAAANGGPLPCGTTTGLASASGSTVFLAANVDLGCRGTCNPGRTSGSIDFFCRIRSNRYLTKAVAMHVICTENRGKKKTD